VCEVRVVRLGVARGGPLVGEHRARLTEQLAPGLLAQLAPAHFGHGLARLSPPAGEEAPSLDRSAHHHEPVGVDADHV
jgi:hypothetical protein